jgi:hypothetical protein
MAPTEFHAALGTVGIAQQRVAQLFGVGPRSVRRWQYGERRVPQGVGIVFRLLAAGVLTVEQVEQATVPLFARTNGGAKPEPPVVEPALEQSIVLAAPALEPPSELSATLAEPAPEPSTNLAEPLSEPSANLAAPALERSVVLADPVITVGSELTLAEKVAALTARACRWPCGDPQRADFHFCGGAVVAPPYCEEHRGVAYVSPPTRWVRRRAAACTRPPVGSHGQSDADAARDIEAGLHTRMMCARSLVEIAGVIPQAPPEPPLQPLPRGEGSGDDIGTD